MLDKELIILIFCLTIPIISFISGLIVMYFVQKRCMYTTMSLAYRIRENMPYEKYDEIEQESTGE